MAPKPLTKLQKYSAPALEKGLDILELLSLSATEMSFSQIAAGVGRSKNEIFRMMIVLEERQFIVRTSGDNYHLTDRLAVLGSKRSEHNRLAEVAMPVLMELSEKSSFSCHLSVMDGDAVIVVAQAEATKGYSISVQVGHRSRVAESSARMCILASARHQGEDDRASRTRATDGNSDSPSQDFEVSQSLPEVTEMPNPELPGITELSAPVMGTQRTGAIAAITIPFMSAMISDSHKNATKSHLLDAASLLHQRVTILLPQL